MLRSILIIIVTIGIIALSTGVVFGFYYSSNMQPSETSQVILGWAHALVLSQ